MTRSKIVIASTLVALLSTGCDVKDPINNTAHPDYGKIALTTDWAERTAGIEVPGSYTVEVGDYRATVSGRTNTLDKLFAPGVYRAYVYNPTGGIVVSGTIAAVDPATRGGSVVNDPGWFFSCALDATIESDKVHDLTAAMRQEVRQLTLVVEPSGVGADRVTAIAARLSGVAGTFDMDTGTYGGTSEIDVPFTRDASDGKCKAVVRLLGISGTSQRLTGTISLAGGDPVSVALDSDLSRSLADFNADKKTPLLLGGSVTIPAEEEIPADFIATIRDWTFVSGGSVVAD